MPGFFITFEGVEGCGKSTQIRMLSDYFCDMGLKFIVARDPGGTEISEKIRNIILDRKNKKMFPMTEALLYAAARCQLVNEVILPALEAGSIVVCDRFLDSSVVYQGYARGLGFNEIEALNYSCADIIPDTTFYLDLLPSIGMRRKKTDDSLKNFDRIENENIDFHNKVYEGFNVLSGKYPNRICKIDAASNAEIIHNAIIKILSERMV